MSYTFGSTPLLRPPAPHLVFEEIVPSSGLTEDSDSYCLIIDLPGFRPDGVKFEVDDYGHLIVSGEKQVDEMKHVRFRESFKLPEKSNIEETTAKFDDGIVYIIIPKKEAERIVENDSEKAMNSQQEGSTENGLEKDEVVPGIPANTGDKNSSEEVEEEEAHEEEEKGKIFEEAKTESEWNEGNCNRVLRTLTMQLIKNKGIVLTAVLAFSLGVFVSQKSQTSHGG